MPLCSAVFAGAGISSNTWRSASSSAARMAYSASWNAFVHAIESVAKFTSKPAVGEVDCCGCLEEPLDGVEEEEGYELDRLRAPLGATAVDVETTGVTVVGVDGTTLAGAALGLSTLSVVGLLRMVMSSPDLRDISAIGSEGILDPA